MLSAAPLTQAEMFPFDFDDAIEMFEDRDDPEAAAMEHIQETLRSARQREKEAFIIFMALELWKPMGLSCESAFIQLFHRAKKTLYRWKKESGFTDWERSAIISAGRVTGLNNSKCHHDTFGGSTRDTCEDGEYSPRRHGDNLGAGGAQMSFEFMAPVDRHMDQLAATLRQLRIEQHESLDEEQRRAAGERLRRQFEAILVEWNEAS